jgi:glyoxylase-like metal-dependent hydrolase (beta-lactamase superfamily II)
MSLNRRQLLGTGAIAVAASTGTLPGGHVMAATPAGGGQAPGFYRFMVGEIEVTLVNDGIARRPLDAGFVRNAELADVQAALEAAFQPPDTVVIPFTTTVLRTGGRVIMIDAGTGGLLAPTAGTWMGNFTAAGFAPEEVELIIVSHFHGDHIQGIRDRDGNAVFPNAQIMVPEEEWAFWMDDGRMSQAPEAMQGAFQGVRRVFAPIADAVERYSGERELAPGVTALPAHGHTPGHNAFVVASGDGRLLVWSDTTNKPELFVRNPSWQAVFDMDGDGAAATRRRLLEMAASERLRVSGYHFPFPANGHIARDGDGFAFVPAFWEPQV